MSLMLVSGSASACCSTLGMRGAPTPPHPTPPLFETQKATTPTSATTTPVQLRGESRTPKTAAATAMMTTRRATLITACVAELTLESTSVWERGGGGEMGQTWLVWGMGRGGVCASVRSGTNEIGRSALWRSEVWRSEVWRSAVWRAQLWGRMRFKVWIAP